MLPYFIIWFATLTKFREFIAYYSAINQGGEPLTLALPTIAIPLNLLIWVILIPIIVLSSMVLSSYMKKKIQPPYKPQPTFLDDFKRPSS